MSLIKESDQTFGANCWYLTVFKTPGLHAVTDRLQVQFHQLSILYLHARGQQQRSGQQGQLM